MEKHRKISSLLLGLFAFVGIGAGFAVMSPTRVFAEEPKNGPVEITCKDYFEKDTTITVEYKDGAYYLADFTRNLYVFDASTFGFDKNYAADMHLYLHEDYPEPVIPVISSTEKSFEDKIAVSVFDNLCKAYDFYTEENVGFDWRGVNGKNDEVRGNGHRSTTEYPIYAFVHYNTTEAMRNNASFNRWDEQGFRPSVILIGDGSGTYNYFYMQHQGASLDTLAHEYQHGITRFLSKSLEKNENETGAINEAMSDIFGMLVRAQNLGYELSNEEKVWKNGLEATSNGSALRDFINPHNVNGYRATYTERQTNSSVDNGGVHYNSTILTHLQYLIYKEDPSDFTIPAIAKLWMETLKTLPDYPDLMQFAETFLTAASTNKLPQKAISAIENQLKASGFGDFHKCTFTDDAGNTLKVSYVRDGGTAIPPEEVPAKDADGHFVFKFTGWDKELSSVTSDMTFAAKYEKVAVYIVRFFDDGGNLLKEEKVEEGKSATPPSTAKEHDDTYRYEFEKWDDSYTNVTSDRDLKASWKKIRIFFVTFLDGEGNKLTESIVDEGGAAAEPAIDPVKEKANGVRYVFEGWDQSVKSVTKNLTVKPKFKEIRYYIVKFEDGNGNALSDPQEVDEGEAATAPKETPTRERTENKRFTFRGWSADFSSVQSDLTITPVFDETNIYKVKFLSPDGSELSSAEVDEGGAASAPSAPQKAAGAQYTYTFKGWSEDFSSVHSDLTLTPVFESTLRKYKVTLYVDGEAQSRELEYGASPESLLPEGTKGWFTDASCTNAFTGTITGELTLYTKKKASTGLFIGLGVGAGVIVIAGAVACVILIRKKKSKQAAPTGDENK